MSLYRETATWCHSTETLLRDVTLQKHWYMTSILLCSDLSLTAFFHILLSCILHRIIFSLVSTSPGTYSWHLASVELVIGSSCAVHSNCLMISTKAWLILAKLDIALFTPGCLDVIETVSTKALDHSFQTIKIGVTNKIYKFTFQKVNLNIFKGPWNGSPSQKIEKLLFLN